MNTDSTAVIAMSTANPTRIRVRRPSNETRHGGRPPAGGVDALPLEPGAGCASVVVVAVVVVIVLVAVVPVVVIPVVVVLVDPVVGGNPMALDPVAVVVAAPAPVVAIVVAAAAPVVAIVVAIVAAGGPVVSVRTWVVLVVVFSVAVPAGVLGRG